MRHAYLQPAGEDGLVARHRADRTCHPLPLSRPSIPRRLNKEIMMKKLALIATAPALFASAPAYAAIRTTTLAAKTMTHRKSVVEGQRGSEGVDLRVYPHMQN